MYRVSVRTQMVAGEIHYHVTAHRSDGRAFAVAELRQSEWLSFLAFAEHDHRFQIEVANETLPTTLTRFAAPERE